MQKIRTFLQLLFTIQQLLLKHYIIKKDILTFDDALVYLEVSDSFLYKKTHTNSIPHFKPNGGKIYFLRSDLDSWILQNKVQSNDYVEKTASTYITLNRKGSGKLKPP